MDAELFGSGSENDENSNYGSPPHTPGSIGSANPDDWDGHGSGSGTSHSGHSSRSGTPNSFRSHSPSQNSEASVGSQSFSGSGSPNSAGSRSRSGSPGSRSPSPAPSGSRSPSPAGSRSRSHSSASNRSRSPSFAGSGSRSPSPAGSLSSAGGPRSPSPSHPGRSRSPSEFGSRSPTPVRSRSVAPRSHSRSRSRSGSRSSGRSITPAGSPSAIKMHSGSDSDENFSGFGSDSGSEIGRKKKKAIASDDEGDGSDNNMEVSATADDLFGEADDISSDEEKGSPGQVQQEDEEKEEEEIPETRIDVEIPKINTQLGRHLHFVKLPNFLSVETRPYDSNTYEDEIDEDEVMDEEGRTRVKLKVENTIRWRTVRDADGAEVCDEFGEPMRESNARMVRWSDGSMSLHLGEEIFDVHTMLLQGDFNHLFIRQGTGLQGQAVFKTKLTFRPHSTDSFTHRKMTMSMADRSTKTQKVKVLPIAGKDPESHRTEMIKKEEERLRASIRRESQQRRIRERATQRGLNSSYLDDDEDDENAISISALKNKYKQSGSKQNQPTIYTSSEEGSSSDEETKRKRLLKAKKLDSDEEGSGSDSEVERKKPRLDESDEAGSDHSSSHSSLSDDD